MKGMMGTITTRKYSRFIILLIIAFCSTYFHTSSANDSNPSLPESKITITAAGDWDDHWDGVTAKNLRNAANSDLIALLGDLSYGKNTPNQGTRIQQRIQNAKNWCRFAKFFANKGKTPMIFVPGDHDSVSLDGDIKTYADCLVPISSSSKVISQPKTKLLNSRISYLGHYPYLYYVDLKRGQAKVRVVGTTIAFPAPNDVVESKRKYLHSYSLNSGSPGNFEWLKEVYKDAKQRGYWLVHINHLPCIDMGKNLRFRDCQSIVDLDAKMGVNLILDGSSHSVWRTHPLKISGKCPTIKLSNSPVGANPECVLEGVRKRTRSTPFRGYDEYFETDGLINLHAGTGGKRGNPGYPDLCNPSRDSEVKHYGVRKTCRRGDQPSGILKLEFTSKQLIGRFVQDDGSEFLQYRFKVKR